MNGTPTTTIPKPELGDKFVRKNPGGLTEQALIVGLEDNGLDWVALVLTIRGPERLEGTREHLRTNDWRPVDWVWDDKWHFFKPDGTEWDPVKQEFVKPGQALPAKRQIPPPLEGEHHSAWKKRCREQYPSLGTKEGQDLLSEMWTAFKAREHAAK